MSITLKDIHDRCDEVGDCWIWKQAVSQTGYPIIRRRPDGCLLVRRVAVALDGREAMPRQPVVATCGEALCVNPAHLKATSNSDAAKRAAERGVWSGKARGAKIAAARRSQPDVKLDMEKAREIRMSAESGPVLAERYGVTRNRINDIKRGTAWKDYANPYAALGAR